MVGSREIVINKDGHIILLFGLFSFFFFFVELTSGLSSFIQNSAAFKNKHVGTETLASHYGS